MRRLDRLEDHVDRGDALAVIVSGIDLVEYTVCDVRLHRVTVSALSPSLRLGEVVNPRVCARAPRLLFSCVRSEGSTPYCAARLLSSCVRSEGTIPYCATSWVLSACEDEGI